MDWEFYTSTHVRVAYRLMFFCPFWEVWLQMWLIGNIEPAFPRALHWVVESLCRKHRVLRHLDGVEVPRRSKR